MQTMTIQVPDDLSEDLETYRDHLADLLRIGLKGIRMEQALGLLRRGDLSLWKAARIARVSLREMTQYAVSQGVRAPYDEKMAQEELS